MEGGAEALAAVSTFASWKVIVVAAEVAFCGRRATPSKLKFVALVSLTEEMRVMPLAVLDQLTVNSNELAPVRSIASCRTYAALLANPEKRLVLPGPLASEVQSPLVPSKEVSARVVRLRRSIGEELLKAVPMFWNN